MPKDCPSITSLMRAYAEQLITLTDRQGKPILAQMAKAAIPTRYHHLHIHPYDESVLPDALYLPHAEYELDRYCVRFVATLNTAKYKGHDIYNAHLDVHFDFANLSKQGEQQSLPCHITMHLDESTKCTEYLFWTEHETQPHDIALTANITLQLSAQDIILAQQPIQPWYPDLPDVETRIQASTQLLYPDLPMPEPIKNSQPLRFPCACCGFPTMTTIDDYDYCDLCDWMDDKAGFDIHDELYFARKQFELLGERLDLFNDSLYTTKQEVDPHKLAIKHKLVTAYLALLALGDKQHPDFDKLWQHVIQCEQDLKNII